MPMYLGYMFVISILVYFNLCARFVSEWPHTLPVVLTMETPFVMSR